MIGTTNRVLDRIERYRTTLAAGLRIDGQPLPASFDPVAFEASMDNSFAEHAAFQNAQSRAFAMGRLTVDEAMTIYTALGEVPGDDGWAAGADLATKIVVTAIMGELLR